MTHKNIFFRFIFFHLLNFIGCELAEIVDNDDSCTQYPGGILDNFGRKYLTQIQTQSQEFFFHICSCFLIVFPLIQRYTYRVL